jgi:hypothetical protein
MRLLTYVCHVWVLPHQNLVDASAGKWTTLVNGEEKEHVELPFDSFDFAYMTDADQEFRQDVCEDILGTRYSSTVTIVLVIVSSGEGVVGTKFAFE